MKRGLFLKNLFQSKIFLIFCLFILVLLIFSTVRVLIKNYEIGKEISHLEKEIKRLKDKKEELTKLIEYFKTPSFQEREARLKLGYKKPGEKVVIVLQKEKGSVEERKEKESNPLKWWNYFFK